MATAYVSATDRAEAELVGRARGRAGARRGPRVSWSRWSAARTRLRGDDRDGAARVVANQQQRLPDAFIDAGGNGLTDAFVAYATPLIGEPLPAFVSL